jgi:hypothetical protein
MPATILTSQIPADGDQRKLLTKLFVSPEYSFLKQVIAAHCIKAQAESLNAGLYEHNSEKAEEAAKNQRLQAELYNKVLDVLDEIADKEEKWFTVKLEPRR